MTGSVQTLAKGDGSLVVEPRRFVVRSRAAFAAIWAAHVGPDVPEPTVDFDSQMVAAVFAGERPTPGHEITIVGTRREGAELVVLIDERPPDPARVAAQIIVSPFHIASLPREDGQIRFADAHAGATAPARSPASTATPHVTRTPRRWPADSSHDGAPSSTGLTPRAAATLAYLAGPFSGALMLATERTSRFVRFHAWQAVIGLGVLGTAAVVFLILAFVLLIASPIAFWTMLWLSAFASAAWLVVWAMCVVQAYKGRLWKLPVAGDYAERYTDR